MRPAISAILGVVIFVITYLCAWLSLREVPNVQGTGILYTKFGELRRIDEMLNEIAKEKGKYPTSLSELKEHKEGAFDFDDSGQLLDLWDNPYVYELTDAGPKLYSYGTDGKPGGVGVYSDIYLDRPDFKDTRPTFFQFSFELESGKSAFLISVITGVLASVVCYRLTEPSEEAEVSKARLLVNIMGLTVAAIVFSFMLNLLYSVPSGH